MKMRRLCVIVATLALVGCTASRTMLVPRFDEDEALTIREDAAGSIADALSVQPQFVWPARLAVVEVGPLRDYYGGYGPKLSSTEEDLWIDAVKNAHPDIEAVVPVSDLFLPRSSYDSSGRSALTLRDVRLAATGVQADLVLVYQTRSDWGENGNPLSLLYLTIVGLWVSPGTDLESIHVAQGALIDVRNGFVYGVVSADNTGKTVIPEVYSEGALRDLQEKTRNACIKELARETADLLADLKRRYPGRITSRPRQIAEHHHVPESPPGLRYQTSPSR